MELIGKFKDTAYPFSYIDHNRTVARAIILNENNEILLITVQRDDIFGNERYIETPGGGVNDGESLENGVLREIEEECGLEVEIISEIGLVEDDYNLIHRHNLSYYFLCRIIKKCSSHQEDYEKEWFKSLNFYSIDEILKITSNPSSKIEQVVYQRERAVYLKVKEML